MNFFNDIGRAFQSAGQTINNEVIKPAENTLNPNFSATRRSQFRKQRNLDKKGQN